MPHRYTLIGTAGHIDHGKTSLVRALTGVDTDRLPEEKRRGMTIELGFAPLRLGDWEIGIVDVPGHERFIRTMVAGASGIDLALLVVAANEGVMPQTREHLDILTLLGIGDALVVLTKSDLVDEEWIRLVIADVKTFLQPSPFAHATILPVSATTGEGLDALKAALIRRLALIRGRDEDLPFRMAIDRVFTIAGRGCVVTGSVLSGLLREGDGVEVHPIDESYRVRGLQSHKEATDALAGGRRAAVNLAGADWHRITRGMELATPGYLSPARILDGRVEALAHRGKATDLDHGQRYRLAMGTREEFVRLITLDRGPIAPGHSAYAQFRLRAPVVATWGQRFILRDESGTRTVGGGVILRPSARRWGSRREEERETLERISSDDPLLKMEQVLADRVVASPNPLHLSAATGIQPAAVPGLLTQLDEKGVRFPLAGRYILTRTLGQLADRLAEALKRLHEAQPDAPGLKIASATNWVGRRTAPECARDIMAQIGKDDRFKLLGEHIALAEFAPKLSRADERILEEWVKEIDAAGFSPPLANAAKATRGLSADRMRRLAQFAQIAGHLLPIREGIYLTPKVEKLLRERVIAYLEHHGRMTVADLRDLTQSSRKYCVPYMEYLDRIGLTQRDGDDRVLADPAARI